MTNKPAIFVLDRQFFNKDILNKFYSMIESIPDILNASQFTDKEVAKTLGISPYKLRQRKQQPTLFEKKELYKIVDMIDSPLRKTKSKK